VKVITINIHVNRMARELAWNIKENRRESVTAPGRCGEGQSMRLLSVATV
jgi:hypothetical protein